jgi:hypothetical protein
MTIQEMKNMLEDKNSKLRQKMAEREENAYMRGTTYTDKFMKFISA